MGDRRIATNLWSRQGILLIAALLVVAVALIRTAWICDDAYITFRTIDNFLHGFGLRWNVAERVTPGHRRDQGPPWRLPLQPWTSPSHLNGSRAGA